MIKLNDYLYSGNTVLKILHQYSGDLKKDAFRTGNSLDMAHVNFLIGLTGLLEHNDFLTGQSQRIREFYNYMVQAYPFLAFTFKGRIKSLIRAEEKFNGRIVNYIYEYYRNNKKFPSVESIKSHTANIRDLIAYRIVVSLPKCHLPEGKDLETCEIKYLYEIADALPAFLEQRGFSPVISDFDGRRSPLLSEDAAPYYKDYIASVKDMGYRSLHIVFFDNVARSFLEVQLRTKEMDDQAEIGNANHTGYEERQEKERARRKLIPAGTFDYFDEAYERVTSLQDLDLTSLDVNMFSCFSPYLINDGCGLYRGRQILPFEHLSRFQNDLLD